MTELATRMVSCVIVVWFFVWIGTPLLELFIKLCNVGLVKGWTG